MKHVTKHERPGLTKPWRVRIRRNGKNINGGYYATEAEAGEAALKLEAKLDSRRGFVASSDGKYVHMFDAVVPFTVISRFADPADIPARVIRQYVAAALRSYAKTPEEVTVEHFDTLKKKTP